jgi:hypothetical protein
MFFWRRALLAALLVCMAARGVAGAEAFIGYLYVAPNEGDSSGGHVALRFTNETFHFQHEPPGILRLQRHDAAAFRYMYAGLGNRAIRESRIAVSSETYAAIRDAFARLLLVQDAQMEVRDALRKNVEFFELLLRQQRDGALKTNELRLPVSGLGYFFPDASPPSSPSVAATPAHETVSPALVALRNRIRASYGAFYLPQRVAEAKALLQGLQLTAIGNPPTELTSVSFPNFVTPVARRFEDAVQAVLAVQILEKAPALRDGTYWRADDSGIKLEPEQLLALKNHAADLEEDLVALVKSSRPDWGAPFILGMARLGAIEATVASGRLVLLDLFAPAGFLPPRQDRAMRPYLPMLRKELRAVFFDKMNRFLSERRFREGDYASMERAGNLLLDVERSLKSGAPLRAVPRHTFPSREAVVAVPLAGEPDEATLTREVAAAKTAEAGYLDLLTERYGYDLFRHNCVTEIFSVINSTMAAAATESAIPDVKKNTVEEATRRLGGYLDAREPLAFIPIVSSRMVQRSYAVTSTQELPSYRGARVRELQAREGTLRTYLRECNTITSSVYRPGPDDSAFLFFTDDAFFLRPLFGAFNLVAGVAEGLWGVATLPLAGPERMISGARGILFSLPELVFVNLRKGSMAYVEETQTDAEAGSDAFRAVASFR